jgi:hypothetical protein
MEQEFIKNSRYEIYGESGWENFDGVVVNTGDFDIYEIKTDNHSIKCTDKHKIYTSEGVSTADEVERGDILFIQGGITEEVISTQYTGKQNTTYDIFNSDSHKVHINQILTSNCDEFAFVEPSWKAEEFWASNYPTISAAETSKIIIISCVAGDTYVYTDNGVKQISNIIGDRCVGGHEIESYGVLGKDKIRGGRLIVNSGITKTRKIITTNSELEGSLDHKLWSSKDGVIGWHKISELNEGDYVSLQYGMNVWGNNDHIGYVSQKRRNKQGKSLNVENITEDWAYLFGLYISEGCADKYRLNISCGDDISDIFDRLGLSYSCSDGMHYVTSNLSLIELLEHVGFDIAKNAPDKIIPDRLMCMSKENIAAMLSGIFDGDGFSRKDKGTIGIGLSSKKLVQQIRVLLMNMGMLGEWYEVESKPTDKVKVHSIQHRYHLDKSSSKKFYEEIGFRLKRKQLNENILGKVNEPKNDIIPYSKTFIDGKGIVKDVEQVLGSYVYNRGLSDNISRGLMIRIKESLGDTFSEEIHEYFNRNVSENIKWCKIKSIEESKNTVYDFSLPDNIDDEWCHSVIYNGFIGHQTPNGLYNKFHEIYKNADEKTNSFIATRYDYSAVPGRDAEWAKVQRMNLGPIKFQQEFGCFFQDTVITIQNEETGLIENITIGELNKRMGQEIGHE